MKRIEQLSEDHHMDSIPNGIVKKCGFDCCTMSVNGASSIFGLA